MRNRQPASFRRLIGLAALAWALSAPGAAAPRQVQQLGKERPDVVARWRESLQEADEMLSAGEWKQVRKATNRLLGEMCERIERGPSAAVFLATAAVQRAVAEAGLGNARDAAWDWHMAVSLHPDFAALDLTGYGEAGALLARQRQAVAEIETVPLGPLFPDVRPPRRRLAPRPKYPRAKRIACLEEAIVIGGVVDAEGRPQAPRLLTPSYPVLGFAAMDALRAWRYEPARQDGEPVPVAYSLTVNFEIELCTNLAAIRAKARER